MAIGDCKVVICCSETNGFWSSKSWECAL